jgi:para-nitrobenzyl esterase
MKICGFSLLALLLFTEPASAQRPGPVGDVMQTTDGALHGAPRDANGVLSFMGVPFAAAPVGPLRWRNPQPVRPWPGVREAAQVSSHCWANALNGGAGAGPQSEDCLYLNVWTAAKSADERRPVMVWIHGGGFQFGSSRDPRTDGELLAQKGVVIVSVNYRLGVFGFFAHPQLRSEGRLDGNFGIHDQIAALKWVRANIAKFGGDAENVTIFGESSGSQGVSILMGSPLAKGLFQKAIGESGSSLQVLPSLMEIGLRGAAYGGALGAKSVENLRAMPAERLNAAAAWDFAGGAPPVFTPGVDGYLIPTQLTELFKRGGQNDVPLLAGYNKREDFPFLANALPHRTAAEFRAAAEHLFGAAKMPEFLRLYPSDTDAATTASAQQLLAEIRQSGETWNWLSLAAKTGRSPVFGYVFSYESPYSPIATHGAEIPFVFGNLAPQSNRAPGQPSGPRDRTISDTMMSYWVNFAAKSDPNGPGLPRWPNFDVNRGSMLQIDEGGQIISAPPSDRQKARFRFLDGFLISASSGEP